MITYSSDIIKMLDSLEMFVRNKEESPYSWYVKEKNIVLIYKYNFSQMKNNLSWFGINKDGARYEIDFLRVMEIPGMEIPAELFFYIDDFKND